MNFSRSKIKHLIVHEVGNKLRDESFFLSNRLLSTNEELERILLKYLLQPFYLEKDLFNFTHNSDLSFNEMYSFSNHCFEQRSDANFIETSKKIAKHLYEFSLHPRVTRGELILVYFENIVVENKKTDAIGVFKSENKHDFLKVLKDTDENEINIKKEVGIDLLKLDKACLILNLNKDLGLRVLNFDRHNKVTEYWATKFLNVKKITDEAYKTKKIISLCKSFSENVLQEKYNSNASWSFNNDFISYFDNNESFDFESFQKEAFKTKNVRQDFLAYIEANSSSLDLDLQEKFSLSKKDINAEKKKIKNAIKLDTNIELKMALGNEESLKNIEKGFDKEKGMHFYKIYFNSEIS